MLRIYILPSLFNIKTKKEILASFGFYQEVFVIEGISILYLLLLLGFILLLGILLSSFQCLS